MQLEIGRNDDGSYTAQFKGEFNLKLGGKLTNMVIAYEAHGELAPNKDNVIVVHHSLAPSAHIAAHAGNLQPGWWDDLVGPGKAIDTDKYYVLCFNNLGSCYGSTGPSSINPATKKAYQASFPAITIEDMVISQKMVLDALGIAGIHAAIGGSMGGMLTLAWGKLFPKHAQYLIAISMCHKTYPLQRAHRECQREAIYLDSAWQQGNYHTNPVQGLKVARMISHLFYRGLTEVDARFLALEADKSSDSDRGVVSYYHYNSLKFANQFDSCSYIGLLDAMDAFNLEADGQPVFSGLSAKVLIISTSTDVLYPPYQQQAVYELMKQDDIDVSYIDHKSPYGHDAFLVESKRMGYYIRRFIS